MHLDHDKFFDLLVENSGMTAEKAQKQLDELITEMKAAFDEDEAYEIEGFGIFSKLGSNVLFIPAEELETEINYKYAGMEPIELPGSAETSEPEGFSENPIQGIMGSSDQQEYEDPFAALLNGGDDEELDDSLEEDSLDDDAFLEATEPELKEEVAEEESLDDEDVLSEFFGEETEEDESETESLVDAIDALSEEEDKVEDSTELEEEDPFGHLSEEEDSVVDEEPQDDSEDLEEEFFKPGPESWGIDAHKEAGQENAFSGLMGDVKEESDDEIAFNSDNDEDPFSDVESSPENKEDFVPVVTNVSSEGAKKENNDILDEVLNSKDPNAKTPKKKNLVATIINVLLIVIILAGSGYLLAYFDVIHVEGITKGTTQVKERTTPQQNKEKLSEAFDDLTSEMQEKMQQGAGVAAPEKEVEVPNTNAGTDKPQTAKAVKSTPSVSQKAKEQEPPKEATTAKTSSAANLATAVGANSSNSETSLSNADYGLYGAINDEANSGYTIVLYSLSKKTGADDAVNKLKAKGLRAMIKETPSTKYGVLYRVSVGQFRTLVDAATAVEENKDIFIENYFITKIK